MTKRLLLLLIFSTIFPLEAQSRLKLKEFGARTGWGRSADLAMNNIIIPGLSVNLGHLQPHLLLFGYMDYWNKSKQSIDKQNIQWRVLGISAITKYTFPNQTKITPFVGGGVGFNFGKGDINSSFDLAIHFLGGISIPITKKLKGVVELKYSMDGADYLGIFMGINYQIR